MYVYVVRTCIRCGTNMYLGGTKMGGTKRRWYEKTGNQAVNEISVFIMMVSISDRACCKLW